MNKMNLGNWFEIYVQDMPRAKAFYESVFEVKLERLDSPELEIWAFPMSMEGYGCSGALVYMQGVQSGGNSTIVYFRCDDCGPVSESVAKFGGKIHKAKFSIGQYGFISLVTDTEGNMFGLHSMQ